tara:strand:+ start:2935 stop:3078 length:144 start_codon:yes stop_codon:yes gene_type:complete
VKAIEHLTEDPIIQLMIFVIIFIGILDAFRFAAGYIWKALNNNNHED